MRGKNIGAFGKESREHEKRDTNKLSNCSPLTAYQESGPTPPYKELVLVALAVVVAAVRAWVFIGNHAQP
ncbi:hypothetical protein HaLaN_11129 [Haematococcus lacustris]|uniref:Uncharacterized protein n=1 Tax=Haematococcus lacustris TaxID=44745 RepID=A0A699Z822_HAELA|nr:hypothetical protein HaLaN_11129 [Haematococcus lacustris]